MAESEGIPLVESFFIKDIAAVPLKSWKRTGGLGVRLCLEGTGETNDAYICEIPPGKSLAPEKHVYEEMIYVISGRGAATIWNDGEPKRTFEWQEGSLFSPPLNSWHEIFNGNGSEPARFLAVTSAPCMMNLIHNTEFIFNCPYVFTGRTWQTNFVADVKNLKLLEWKERGGGGSQVRLELSENTLCGHISQFAVGSYKKANFHGPGAHVIILAGQGYSLLWPRGQEIKRFDWRPGSLVVPPGGWFHQHFNSGSVPVRYLALRWGSQKYHEMWGEGRGKADIDVKLGGNQIEYEDEDPIVRNMFSEACAKAGVSNLMEKYYMVK